VSSVYFLPLARVFPQSLVRNLKARTRNKRVSGNLPKVLTPFLTFKALFKLLPPSKRLKAHLIIKRSAFKTFKTHGSIYCTLNARNNFNYLVPCVSILTWLLYTWRTSAP